jgi:hypothetical protein
MKMHDIGKYYEAKEKLEELEPVLKALDDVCKILYDNIAHRRILRLIETVEDVRVDYYIKHYECQQIVNNKGKVLYE